MKMKTVEIEEKDRKMVHKYYKFEYNVTIGCTLHLLRCQRRCNQLRILVSEMTS